MKQTIKDILKEHVCYVKLFELNQIITAYEDNTLTARQSFLLGVILGGVIEAEVNNYNPIHSDYEKIANINDFIKTALVKPTERK